MQGVFGGEVHHDANGSIERAPRAVVEALSLASRDGPNATSAPKTSAVTIVTYAFDVAREAVAYSADLRESLPIDEAPALARSTALAALADVAAALAPRHAVGIFHGDLRPATVRIGPRGPWLLIPARTLAPGASLAARLRNGAPASDVSFAAPEVVTCFEATEASDVYALAALTHRILSGFAPLGQIDFGAARDPRAPFAELADLVASCLSATPARRASLGTLEAALRFASKSAARMDTAPSGGGPYRAEPHVPRIAATSPAQAAAMQEGASSMSAILVLVLVVGGFFVLVGAIWLVAVNWDALGEVGRFALLGILTAGVAVGGVVAERRGSERSGFALVILASQLLWADAAYLLHLLDVVEKPGPWAVASAAVTAVTFGLAVWKRSGLAASLAAAGFGAFGACLGAFLSTGSDLGPATWGCVVALGYAALAALGHRLAREAVGVPFAVGALACGWLSAFIGLVLLNNESHRSFGTLWPYAMMALAAACAFVPSDVYRATALVAAGGLIALVPTFEALIRHDVLAYAIVAIAIGFAGVASGFVTPWASRDATRQHTVVLLGLISAVAAPSILFLAKCNDKDGLDVLGTPAGVYLLLVCAIPTTLIGLSYGVSSRATQKTTYRLVELVALLQFFGLFTLESLLRFDDFFYPLALGGVAVVVIGAGVATRRATLVMLASVALLLNLWIQYFEKLRHAFPTSVLVLGFGIGLLGFGVLYERRVRHLLPQLDSWA